VTIAWTGEHLTISNSEIQTWKSCRRKWWLTYYRELGMKQERMDGPLALGTKVHIALEGLYTDGKNPITIIDDLYAVDLKKCEESEDLRLQEMVVTLKKEQDLAHAMLEGYMAWREEEAIDHGMIIAGAEQVVQVKSGIEGVFLRGKMDQRWERTIDGARRFRDFKTVQEFATPVKILPMDEQMKFYHLLEYLDSLDTTGGEPQWRTDGAIYTMLRKVKRTATAKPPFYMQIEISHNMDELRSMWKRVMKVCIEIVEARQALDAGGDHQYLLPPRPSRDCTWSCPFMAACPMFDDGSNVEQLLDEHYTHVDPHERYREEEKKGEA
jgi:hypothetical protein